MGGMEEEEDYLIEEILLASLEEVNLVVVDLVEMEALVQDHLGYQDHVE
jgi:hypothetical protein